MFRYILQVINSLVSGTVEEERHQPEQQQLKSSMLLFPGSVVLYRGFRQAAPRDVRNITIAEFQAVARQLEPDYGNVVVTRLRRQSKDTVMFIKKNPNDFQQFVEDICSQEQFTAKYNCPRHATVTDNVKSTLVREAHVTAAFFN